MSYPKFIFATACIVMCAVTVHEGSEARGQKAKTPSVSATKSLLTKYCYACHSGEESNGDVSIDTFDIEMTGGNDAEAWKSVLDVINSGDMPPEDEPQPSAKERLQITQWLTSSLELWRCAS